MRHATVSFWEELCHQTLERDPGSGSKGLTGSVTQTQFCLSLSVLGPGTPCSLSSASLLSPSLRFPGSLSHCAFPAWIHVLVGGARLLSWLEPCCSKQGLRPGHHSLTTMEG